MRLINGARARILLFWCPSCHRFAEATAPRLWPMAPSQRVKSA